MAAIIAPSILSADFANLERDLHAINTADYAHIDIMDNHFVPNLTIGLPVVERLNQITPIPLDIHLMIQDPDRWAPAYAETGAASVTFHAEAAQAPIRLARELHRIGSRAGLALKPATPLEPYLPHLREFDMILIMTVEPGFGGQPFIPATLPKIRQLRQHLTTQNLDIWIQVDGGISRNTIDQAAEAGANVFVAGSAVYGAENIPEEITTLRALAATHHHPPA